MSDLKTSQEAHISSLTGAELIRLVQSTLNGYATVSEILALVQASATVTPSFSSTITVDLAPYAGIGEVVVDLYTTPVSGNFTFDLINGTDKQKITVIVKQDGTGSRIWTSGAHLGMTADITSIVLSTTTGKTDYLGFRWNSNIGKAIILATNKGA